MRIKDVQKQDAIFEATVDLVNEIGLQSCSVSKIAKKADVSPATLYIYYENKEDLLVSTYIDLKRKMSSAILKNYDPDLPIRDILRKFWFNGLHYISKNIGYFQFIEQFSNSPLSNKVNREEVDKYFNPMYEVLRRGVDQKIIKNVQFEILSAFIFYPVLFLSKSCFISHLELNEDTIESAFNLAWDAVKL
jgi:AcrR family transcriptional regulator